MIFVLYCFVEASPDIEVEEVSKDIMEGEKQGE
jgi:hypothetical protein